MTQKKLNLKRALYDEKGRRVEVLRVFDNGNIAITAEGVNAAKTVDKYGFNLMPVNYRYGVERKQRVFNKPVETVEYLSLYPDGNVYRKECCPVRTSSYGVENLIQIRVTRRGDKIVKKEFC